MAKPILRRIDPHPGRRTLALSDIHGHSEMLTGALAAAGLTPADRLIVCGDLTEKGPDNLGTLRLLMGLSRRMEVHCLLGNCDQRALRALTGNPADPQAREALCRYIDSRKGWYGCLPAEMLRTLGLSPEDHDALAAVQQRFAPEIAFLKEMPTVLIAPNYVFVHAALPCADESEWERHPQAEFLRMDAFADSGGKFDKWVVCGHWPVALYGSERSCCNPLVREEQRIVSIDGGCVLKASGQINVLMIPDLAQDDFRFTSFDCLPTVVAQDAQEASPHSFCIHWIDNEIEILRENDGIIHIRHLRTGYEMDILSSQIYSRTSPVRCAEVTDYRLPVQPGDKLSLIDPQRCAFGYFCKKDGVIGWYAGRIVEE